MTTKTFKGGRVLYSNNDDDLVITSNKNTQDTNYHIYDALKGVHYLVDTCDAWEIAEEDGFSDVLDYIISDYDMIAWRRYAYRSLTHINFK